ncbi:hypothetical protein CVS40_11483 [Lucilia cuprina]|nr:hypothetical protein CVS40_11483 [Lucilia cuprina]
MRKLLVQVAEELLAVSMGWLNIFDPYFFWKIGFLVNTDHQSLKWLAFPKGRPIQIEQMENHAPLNNEFGYRVCLKGKDNKGCGFP